MNIFGDSDKRNGQGLENLSNLDLLDFSNELSTSLNLEKFIFGKFSHDDIFKMLEEAKILKKIRDRGYNDFKVITYPISDLDNRIYVKSPSDEILIHIRLKVSDFFVKAIQENRKMMYIDWLLTQNIKLGKLKDKKILFQGQEYPGLNIFNELTQFIFILFSKMNCYGVFNIPEYFHDAVLFQKNFLFVDPIKQGHFKSILASFKNHTVRDLSLLIHSEKLAFVESNEVYKWKHGEMLFTQDEYLKEVVFDRNYFEKVKHAAETRFFLLE
ncbi:MAG TPA: hypothetical protein PK079_18950 [Leptospiraceae bacterium]|nr:hypothetical protein [Leptospiraceae bacterium]HMW07268.1 hypothetical protein [Leptospiraceae bacterium]HMY32914.1 hypothetical protein [Leptospiraceae bacterium]HMZ66073.1 hypothetical protein [Leptospiraceae bacterium]HNA09002.1 hypothetical protein [Leptospiraceae bacterium]